MSSHRSGAFVPALRDVEDNLSLPLPNRVRILQELASDLEDLTACFIRDGLSTREARNRALEALMPDARTARALQKIHAPPYLKLTRRFTTDGLLFWERWALAIATLALVAVGASALVKADLLGHPTPFLWLVLGLGTLVLASCIRESFRLWVKKEGRGTHGLKNVLYLSATTATVGFAGAVVDFYHLAGVLQVAPEEAVPLTAEWLHQDAAMLTVAMTIALAGAFGWFVLRQSMEVLDGAHEEIVGVRRIHSHSVIRLTVDEGIDQTC